MRREPGLLFLMVGIGIAVVAVKKAKPVAKAVGDFLVKAGEEFLKAAAEMEKPPVAKAPENESTADAEVSHDSASESGSDVAHSSEEASQSEEDKTSAEPASESPLTHEEATQPTVAHQVTDVAHPHSGSEPTAAPDEHHSGHAHEGSHGHEA